MAASGPGLVAHHFDNLRQQQTTVRFGMWLFLVTEVLFFAGAFVAYTAYRIWFPNEFDAGSAALNVGIASVNTFLLLTSSLTCTLAIGSCYRGDRAGVRRWLLATIILGSAFLGLKAREYYLDYEEGLIPGPRFYAGKKGPDGLPINAEKAFVDSLKKVLDHAHYKYVHVGPYAPVPGYDMAAYDKYAEDAIKKRAEGYKAVNLVRVQLFFMFYYSMTGLHVLHMIIGVGLLIWQYILAREGFFDHPERYVYIEVMALYWHFVDMVWIFLLPLLYLAGPHTLSQAVEQFQLAIGLASGHGH